MIGLALIAGCGDLAQADAFPKGSEEQASSSGGDAADASTAAPDAELDFESTGLDPDTGQTSVGSTGDALPPSEPANIVGIHDGVYMGTVSIDFPAAGACTGSITITVDSGVDPPIIGLGECQGQIFGLPEGGETQIDGELAFDGPSGSGTQVLDGEEVEVTWQGAFNATNFTGTFEGEVDLFGTSLDFEGVWNADR